MKREAAIHSKTGRLARALRLEHWGAIGILESLWHLTAREAPSGDIGKLDNEDIAYGIGWKGDPDRLIQALIECKWLDTSEDHRLLIHDWSEHADDGVHQKLAKSRRLFSDGKLPSLSKIPTSDRPNIERELKRLQEEKKRSNSLAFPKEGEKDLTSALPCLALPEPVPCLALPEPVPGPARPEPEPVPEPSQTKPRPAKPSRDADISAMRTQEEGASSSKARGQPSTRPKIRNINGDTCELEINGKLERMPMRQAQELLERIESLEMAAEVGA